MFLQFSVGSVPLSLLGLSALCLIEGGAAEKEHGPIATLWLPSLSDAGPLQLAGLAY